MLELHAIDTAATQPDIAALAEPHAADAVRVLVSAINGPDAAASVAAAIGLLALARGLAFPVVTAEVDGVGVQINAVTESDAVPHHPNGTADSTRPARL